MFFWVFPVHQARALVSCIQPGLVICFTLDNIHVLMLFSWNIPPSPSPTESNSLFYTSVSLWERVSGWGIHVYPRLIHVNVWQKPLQYCKVISPQLIKKKELMFVIVVLGKTLERVPWLARRSNQSILKEISP